MEFSLALFGPEHIWRLKIPLMQVAPNLKRRTTPKRTLDQVEVIP
jgi:hypothetical protein